MSVSRPSWLIGALQLIFVVGIVGIALMFTAALKPDSAPPRGAVTGEASVMNVSIIRPVPIDFTPTLNLNGVVAAQTQTQIIPEVGGRVIKVGANFKQGGFVKQGELLFQIDPRDYQLAVEQAEANIAAAQSDLQVLEAEAKLALTEWNDLFPGREISSLAAREPQMNAARARLASAKAAKKTAALALSRARVTAASDAKILSTSLDAGQVVAPNQSAGQLFALDNLEISVPLSTDELQLLLPVTGRTATLIFSSGEPPRTGIIVRVNAVLDSRTRLASLFIKPEVAVDLTVGGFVDVVIDAPRVDGAITIPVSALSGRDQVWVIDNGKLYPRTVTVLGETSNSLTLAQFDTADGVLTIPPIEAYAGQPAAARSEP